MDGYYLFLLYLNQGKWAEYEKKRERKSSFFIPECYNSTLLKFSWLDKPTLHCSTEIAWLLSVISLPLRPAWWFYTPSEFFSQGSAWQEKQSPVVSRAGLPTPDFLSRYYGLFPVPGTCSPTEEKNIIKGRYMPIYSYNFLLTRVHSLYCLSILRPVGVSSLLGLRRE